jgi:hypothetical protein
MPSTIADVKKFFVKIAELETNVAVLNSEVKELMKWQKWQMYILAGILVVVLARRF